MKTIPRCMSTQHPDNVTTPFFSDSDILSGDAEVKEAFFVFSQLGCQEQMWDSEGKEADNQVVEKLLSKYLDFFTKNKLGEDFRLTYRVPNPSVEKGQGKILLETLQSIPRAFDAAKAAGLDVAPIFEVIIPMTTSHLELKRVKNYYKQIVIGQRNTKLGTENISVKEWVGDFQPEKINVIPLVENYDSVLNCDSIVSKYLKGKRYEYQRVFLARSDPALNYGSTVAVLLSKIALQKLQKVEEDTSVPILPIIGVGAAPFRGNFAPNNVNNCGEEYPSVQTFTAQSSFKYDHPFRDVVNAVDMINHGRKRPALQIDEKKSLDLMKKMIKVYENQLKDMADLINGISVFVPGRRARKLHVGLFGYSRSMKGMKLPRAIKFCGAFYSIGIPPELLGLSALTEKEFDDLHEHYAKIEEDLKDSVKFLNPKNLSKMPSSVEKGISKVLEWIDFEPDDEYVSISSRVLENFKAGRHTRIAEDIKALAWKRRFLG
ncbi:MAG: phosphoenolpyruvate carboxylase [Candidatus Micrarchaeota archaeon]